MKILKLTSENVKRISVVEITPNGALVGIAGRNEQGKSSVLDSIAYALGGERLVPAEPIRKGQAEAKIVVDLGDFTVTRAFKRDRLPCDCKGQEAVNKVVADGALMAGASHAVTCGYYKFGDTRSTLTVSNKDGADYKRPQAMLDKLLGDLTFDPLAFVHEEPKRQNEILRKIAGIDFRELNAMRDEAVDARRMAKKSFETVAAQAAGLPKYDGVPEEEIPAETLGKEMEEAEKLRKTSAEAHEALRNAEYTRDKATKACDGWQSKIERLRGELAEAEDFLTRSVKTQADAVAAFSEAAKMAEQAAANVPDVSALKARAADIAAVNAKVRANAARKERDDRTTRLALELAEAEEAVKDLDEKKASLLQAAKFPVDGLSLTDDGVTFNGLPFEQASQSQRLRVSVAIGLALNPSLKVLLVRDGSLLDEDAVRAVGEMAEAAGAQVWMEFVGEGPDGTAVVMEDGHAR